jgi:hypothetical protein
MASIPKVTAAVLHVAIKVEGIEEKDQTFSDMVHACTWLSRSNCEKVYSTASSG